MLKSRVIRREVLMGGCLSLFVVAAPCCNCSAMIGSSDLSTGCMCGPERAQHYFGWLSGFTASSFDADDISMKSGNNVLDRAIALTLSRLVHAFQVLPGFAFFDDSDGMNAFATPERLLNLDRSDGTVLFGLEMLQDILSWPELPDASVAAVCAHEFGHIVAYKTGIIRTLAPNPRQPFRAEQHADFMAGYFAGLRRNENPSFPAIAFVRTAEKFGSVGQRGSHGTMQERAMAVTSGFQAATARLDLMAAIQQGVNYAMSR